MINDLPPPSYFSRQLDRAADWIAPEASASRVDWLIEAFALACLVAWLFDTIFARLP